MQQHSRRAIHSPSLPPKGRGANGLSLSCECGKSPLQVSTQIALVFKADI